MRPWFAAIYISAVELTQVKGPGNRNGCAMIDVPLRHSETFVRHCRAPGCSRFSLPAPVLLIEPTRATGPQRWGQNAHKFPQCFLTAFNQ